MFIELKYEFLCFIEFWIILKKVCEVSTTIYEFQKNTKSSDSTFYISAVPNKN